MAAAIKELRTRPEQEADADATQLRLILTRRPELLSDRLKAQVRVQLDRREPNANRWPFVMLSPVDNDRVVEWLSENSSRAPSAMRLWSKLFVHLCWDTGEIVQTREELADAVGIAPRDVSRIMTELEGIGAIIRRREKIAGLRGPGPVRYFMSPRIGTHLTGKARDMAQDEAPLLKLMEKPGV
jgi:hypothetical protein